MVLCFRQPVAGPLTHHRQSAPRSSLHVEFPRGLGTLTMRVVTNRRVPHGHHLVKGTPSHLSWLRHRSGLHQPGGTPHDLLEYGDWFDPCLPSNSCQAAGTQKAWQRASPARTCCTYRGFELHRYSQARWTEGTPAGSRARGF